MTAALRVFDVGSADRERWDCFVAAAEGAEAGHNWGFLELLRELFGQRVHRLVALRGDRWVGVLPLVWQKSLMGRFLTSVPYLNYAGVLAEDSASRTALTAAAVDLFHRLDAHRLELRGRDGSDLPIERWEGKRTYAVELPGTAEPLWKDLGAKVRAQIKRPRKEGYASRIASRKEVRQFYPLLSRRWHELGSPVLPRAFFDRLGGVFDEDLVYVFVERDGRAAAAGALLRCGDTVEIPWAASMTEHNRFGVNMLLYWASMEWAIENGAARFDLGRSTPGTGNARFKLQWGADEQPLVWNVKVHDDRGRAGERGDRRRELMARAWSKLPGVIAGALGPRFAARIPY